MNPRLTALEVIGMAIRSEEDASKFYGHISRMIDNPLVRERFEGLAREEVGHKRMLTEMYKKMSDGQEEPPAIPGSPVTAEGAPIPEGISDSLEELLKLAIQREIAAHDYYRKAAQSTIELSAIRTLEYLADLEHSHQVTLERELEAFRRDRDWYVGMADDSMTHEGP